MTDFGKIIKQNACQRLHIWKENGCLFKGSLNDINEFYNFFLFQNCQM